MAIHPVTIDLRPVTMTVLLVIIYIYAVTMAVYPVTMNVNPVTMTAYRVIIFLCGSLDTSSFDMNSNVSSTLLLID